MIYDLSLLFSDEQAITATAFSTESIEVTNGNTNDKQVAFLDIASGEPIRVVARITESFTLLDSLLFELFINNVDSFSGSEVLVLSQSKGRVSPAQLNAGDTLIDAVLPNDILPLTASQRIFYKVRYSVTGTNPDAGKVFTGFSWGSHSAKHNAT